jgi:hypothetical protein
MEPGYHMVYEPCLMIWKKKQSHYKDEKVNKYQGVMIIDKLTFVEQLDVWYEKRDNTAKYVHPMQKTSKVIGDSVKEE